jgi:hypothetical protein
LVQKGGFHPGALFAAMHMVETDGPRRPLADRLRGPP